MIINCGIVGQINKEPCHTCPRTCSNCHLHCISDNQPGYSCPWGHVINKLNSHWVPVKDYPSKKGMQYIAVFYYPYIL